MLRVGALSGRPSARSRRRIRLAPMASYEVNAYGAEVKVRDPGIVVLFFFLTLGFLIYPQVWYYRINRELRDFGRVYRDEKLADSNPVLSVLAVTLGALLIVPPIVSWWKCTGRIRRAQGIAQERADQRLAHLRHVHRDRSSSRPSASGSPPTCRAASNGIWRKYPAVEAGGAVAQVLRRADDDRRDGHAARAAETTASPVALAPSSRAAPPRPTASPSRGPCGTRRGRACPRPRTRPPRWSSPAPWRRPWAPRSRSRG